MASSEGTSRPAAKSAALDAPAPTSRVHNGPNRGARGRSGRVRGGGRSTNREDQSTKPSDRVPPAVAAKPTKPLLPEKPVLSITAASTPSSATRPKNSSRRPSRANSTISTSHSSPVTPVSPASSRSSNRRRRSGAGKGNTIPKIIPPAPQDNLLRPGRPYIGALPHTAPVKDTPHYLAPKSSNTPTGSFDMSKDIDALVERVRAVAMAEHRPSTPGSHIDWAGDDDDSLPDLDDWGITSLSVPEQRASAISPIIVGALKPLPEPSSVSTNNGSVKLAQKSIYIPKDPTPLNGGGFLQNHPHISSKAQAPPDITVVEEIHPSTSSLPSRAVEAEVTKASRDVESTSELTPKEVVEPTSSSRNAELKETKTPVSSDGFPETDASDDQDMHGLGGLAQSIHAPPAGGPTEPEQGGLAASIHAPHTTDSGDPAPAQLNSRPPHPRQTHGRTQTVGRPFPRPNPNDSFSNRSSRNGRGGFHGSSGQHTRNYSSPAATPATRLGHSRPVLTGDAISRLAKAVGSTTTPSKSTPVVND